MNYKKLGYNVGQRVIANCDKMSAKNDSKVCHSPWGTFKMYKSNSRGRFYSISGSTVFHNRGSLKIGTIKKMIRSITCK